MTDNAKSPILSKNVSSSIGLEPPLRFRKCNDKHKYNRLEDLGYFIGGGTPSKNNPNYWSGTIPWISSADLLEDNINHVNISRYITDEAIVNSATKLCPTDTISIVSRVGVGKVAMTKVPLCTSQDFTNFINNDECCTRYLAYYLSTVMKKKSLQTQGTSIKGITIDEIKNIVLALPGVIEQQKIADFLSLVDERIEKQRQLVEVLKRYKRGLFSSIYSAKQQNWKSVCIGDFSKVYGGYAFDSKNYSESGKYNVLTIGNVSGNRYADIESCNAVEEMPVDIQQYQILQPDDLVVSMTGNVGRVSIVNQDDCLLNQRVAKLDIKDSTIREYVYQVLSCSKFEQEMNNVGQGAAQKNIKNSDIENFIFYIPENNTELNTLARLFLGLDNIILKQEQQLAKLMQSKQSLLQQMFI